MPLDLFCENGMYFSSLFFCYGKKFPPIHIEEILMPESDSERGRYSVDLIPNHTGMEFIPERFSNLLCLEQIFIDCP